MIKRLLAGLYTMGMIIGMSGCFSGMDASRDDADIGTAEQALCSARQTCPSGSVVECSSSGWLCFASQDSAGLYVMCDGAKKYCPASAPCQGGCNNPPNSCYHSNGTCSNGQCIYTPKSAGTSCNDGDSCTSGDACDGFGACVGQTPSFDPAQCDPTSYCQVDTKYITCNNGVQMEGWQMSDCRWCINRDACGWDPVICPW